MPLRGALLERRVLPSFAWEVLPPRCHVAAVSLCPSWRSAVCFASPALLRASRLLGSCPCAWCCFVACPSPPSLFLSHVREAAPPRCFLLFILGVGLFCCVLSLCWWNYSWVLT
eukprot:7884509-Pyramimonas_sp.AAC.1